MAYASVCRTLGRRGVLSYAAAGTALGFGAASLNNSFCNSANTADRLNSLEARVANANIAVETTVKAELGVLQKANTKLCIGIMGGSGFDDPDILQNRKEAEMMTPFGAPSGPVVTGQIGGVDCVLIARHGLRVRLLASFPFRPGWLTLFSCFSIALCPPTSPTVQMCTL
jgi:hypothetical protein